MAERVTFITTDNVIIISDWYKPNAPNGKAVLLLHMMPAVRGSWDTLAQRLTQEGYHILAIDLRGHGESVNQNGATLDYKKFIDAQHQAYALDVAASMDFLREQGFDASVVSVGGASIGANLALNALHAYPTLTHVFALSPGLNYRGVTTQSSVMGLDADQKIFLVASAEDEYSAQSIATLHKTAGSHSTITHYNDNAGHGTTMFEKHPELMGEITAWLKQ